MFNKQINNKNLKIIIRVNGHLIISNTPSLHLIFLRNFPFHINLKLVLFPLILQYLSFSSIQWRGLGSPTLGCFQLGNSALLIQKLSSFWDSMETYSSLLFWCEKACSRRNWTPAGPALQVGDKGSEAWHGWGPLTRPHGQCKGKSISTFALYIEWLTAIMPT